MREQVPSKLEFRQKTDRVHQFTSFVDLQRHFIQSHSLNESAGSAAKNLYHLKFICTGRRRKIVYAC